MAGAQPAQFGEGVGPIVLNLVHCFPQHDATLLECRRTDYFVDCDHSKDAGVRCEVDPRLKNISASMLTSADDMTAHTVLTSDGSCRTTCSHIILKLNALLK